MTDQSKCSLLRSLATSRPFACIDFTHCELRLEICSSCLCATKVRSLAWHVFIDISSVTTLHGLSSVLGAERTETIS